VRGNFNIFKNNGVLSQVLNQINFFVLYLLRKSVFMMFILLQKDTYVKLK